jgi:TldD protein
MKLSKATAIEILNNALSTGADYAEIYYQDNQTHSYTRRFKKVYSVTGGRTCGIGIRLLKGVKAIYGYTSDLSKKRY